MSILNFCFIVYLLALLYIFLLYCIPIALLNFCCNNKILAELRWVHDTTKCYRFVRFVRYRNYRTIVNIDYATVRYETNDTVE